MRDRFNTEINLLKQRLLDLAGEVVAMLEKTALALQTMDVKLATEVIQKDAAIDLEEVEIEEECLKLIALYQPVAADLRLLITILKVNGEVERIADLARGAGYGQEQMLKMLARNVDFVVNMHKYKVRTIAGVVGWDDEQKEVVYDVYKFNK